MKVEPYFRPGVGCVVYQENSDVLVFSRKDHPEVWQFPQGGMEVGETAEETLWRELNEETGLTQADFTKVMLYPDWTVYTYDKSIMLPQDQSNCLGQVHRWFFLKFRTEATIDLARATDLEFYDFRWVSFETLLNETGPLKKSVYIKLYSHLKHNNFFR